MTAANAEAPARCTPPPNRRAIGVQPDGEAVGVRPTGELDLTGSRRLRSVIDELVETLDMLPFDRQLA